MQQNVFIRKTFPIALLLLFIAGCATASVLSRLTLGMTKKEVVSAIGEPAVARGALKNKYEQTVEVWEYLFLKTEWDNTRTAYWLYFYDGRLVQWGEAGDWRREADRIYEMRFR